MGNFTAFKVYVSIYGNLIENIQDRFLNSRERLKSQKAAMREKVEEWCESIYVLSEVGYKIRFDQNCGCSCPCSPGFRVLVNERDVKNSGYTQLLWNRRGSNGPQNVYIDGDSIRVQSNHKQGII